MGNNTAQNQEKNVWRVDCRVSNIVNSNDPTTSSVLKHHISTGIGFLDHMIDQLYSHAQIIIFLQVDRCDADNLSTGRSEVTTISQTDHLDDTHKHENRNASYDQVDLLSAVGSALGASIRESLLPKASSEPNQRRSSTFACPLDEALTKCIITDVGSLASNDGLVTAYTLSPYGIYPSTTGRTYIGSLQTSVIEIFWNQLAKSINLLISLEKIRGTNAHHIVESSFKAFARGLRNFLDDVDTTTMVETLQSNSKTTPLSIMYGPNSLNNQLSIALNRSSCITRKTKETSIRTEVYYDNGVGKGVQIDTGIRQLDEFFKQLAQAAGISLQVLCSGDLHIDEHHTAEDVAISFGQCVNDALGNKAGLNRMWCATEENIFVVVDVSNRPCFVHNFISLHSVEKVNDLSCEMFEHVIDSIVVNARLTVHIIENGVNGNDYTSEIEVSKTMMATARALGRALKYCCLVDNRRAGATASSKGTLSV